MTKKIGKVQLIGSLAMVAMFVGTISSSVVYADGLEGGFIHMSPVKTSIGLDAGETYSGTFKVSSTSNEKFDYKLYASPYQITDDNGSPTFDVSSKYTEVTDWITFDRTDGTLEPGETQDVGYTVKVPSNATGGGQYAVLFAETVNPSGEGGFVNTTSRVGELLYLTVNGENNECAKIISESINTFMFEPPITANSLVEACGNVHQEATYIMKVYPLFSDQTVYSNEENPEIHTILPETRRYTTVAWTKEQGAPMMGIFNVEQTVKIGKETSTIKKLVFIFPLWLVIIIILLIAAIIFWLVSRSRARKESKRESVNTSARD